MTEQNMKPIELIKQGLKTIEELDKKFPKNPKTTTVFDEITKTKIGK